MQRERNGQAMLEYALIACVLLLASYGAIRLFLDAWKIKFNTVATTRAETGGILGP